MKPQLLLFPCNGNAMEALSCAEKDFEVLGFVDDTPEKQAKGCLGYPVFSREALKKFPQAKVLAVPGGPQSYQKRLEVIRELGVEAGRWTQVIHPSAQVSRHAKLGTNLLVMAGVVITSNAQIEDHVCILPNSVIHHDVVIGEGTLIGALVSVSGSVKVGRNAYVGTGSSLIHGIEIGTQCLVGLGSNVLRSTESSSVVAGNPARKLR